MDLLSLLNWIVLFKFDKTLQNMQKKKNKKHKTKRKQAIYNKT